MRGTAIVDRPPCFHVVHPLDDVPEEKCSTEGLGLIPMTKVTKIALVSLRVYIFLMIPVLIAFVLRAAGVF